MTENITHGRRRNKRIAHFFATSMLTKITTTAVTLVSLPIAHYALDREQFSLWLTVTALLSALQFADLGVGNGLTNMVAVANAHEDKTGARIAISSSIGILLMLSALLLSVFACVFPLIDWTQIYNLSSKESGMQSGIATAIMVFSLALNLPLMTAQRVQLGYQEGFKSNAFLALGSIFLLCGVLICSRAELGLTGFVIAATGGPLVASLLCWIYEFCFDRPWLFPRYRSFRLDAGRRALKEGSVWTVFQLIAFIGIGLDNMIILHLFGPASVAEYSVLTRIWTGLLLAQMLSAPLWPAFMEAMERGDLTWVRKTFNRSLLLCAAVGAAGGATILILGPWVIQHWMGSELTPTDGLLAGFALWCLITNFFAPIAAFMSGSRLLPTLTKLTATAALSSFVLKLLIAPYLGVEFVIWANVIGYGLICMPGLLIVRSHFDR